MEEDMEEDIKKALKEINVVRNGLILKVPGFEVFGDFDSHYISLTIHLPQNPQNKGRDEIQEIKIDKQAAKEIKERLITRRASTIREESSSDETTSYVYYDFTFDDDGAQLIISKGKRYPMIEKLQPKPRKTKIYINSAESIAVIAVIEQFLILQEKYRANKSMISKKIMEYLEKQKKEDDEFISRLVKELNLDPRDGDVSSIFKDQKESFPLLFEIIPDSE
jgi:hypothetical protein